MQVAFNSGGVSIPTDVFTPTVGVRNALVILAYGSDGLVDNANGPWKTMIEGYGTDLAAQGFTAAIPDYFARTGTSPGDLDPSNPAAYSKQILAHRAAWQTVLEDAAIELTKPFILPGLSVPKIGYLGFSLGGLLCARASESVSTLVVFFAPIFDGLGLSGTLSLKAEIHHGEKDFLAYSTNAVAVEQQLTARGAVCHLWPAYPGAVHGFTGADQDNTAARSTSRNRTMTFFGTHL